MSIAPSRQLNTTMELSPQRTLGGSGSPSRRLNTTMHISPDHNKHGASGSNPVNLNETFDADDAETGFEVKKERSRQVTRNVSYVVRREEESPNNNTLAHVAPPPARVDLNNTFTYDGDGDVDICQISMSGSHHPSMESLNSRVESQIRSKYFIFIIFNYYPLFQLLSSFDFFNNNNLFDFRFGM